MKPMILLCISYVYRSLENLRSVCVADIMPLKVFKIKTKTWDYLGKRSCVCRRCAGRV